MLGGSVSGSTVLGGGLFGQGNVGGGLFSKPQTSAAGLGGGGLQLGQGGALGQGVGLFGNKS